MKPPLRGFRSFQGRFAELIPAKDGSLVSEELGLQLVPEGPMLRLINLKSGNRVLTWAKQMKETQDQARAHRRQYRAARHRVAQQLKEHEQEKRRATAAQKRADREKLRADRAVQMLEKEKLRTMKLVTELERLSAQLHDTANSRT